MFVLFIHLLLVYSASWWQPECRRTNTGHVGWRGLRTLYWILRVTDVTLLKLWNHMANKDVFYNSYKMYCCDKWYKIANIICFFTICKHAYSNTLKILPPKNENFQIENSDIFSYFCLNIDCGYSLEPPRRGGSNEYHNLCFWAEIRKIIYTPVNPSFTI